MQNYPEHFQQLNIWLPKFGLITTTIDIGEEKSFNLTLDGQLQGKLKIHRAAL